MIKSKMSSTINPGRVVNFPCDSFSVCRGSPKNELLFGVDYMLDPSGKIKGYSNGQVGISTFGWKTNETHPKHEVAKLHHPCTILTDLPPSLVLYYDYNVILRSNSGSKRLLVPHFSICAIEDGVYSLEDWHLLIHGGREGSCTWTPREFQPDNDGELSFPVVSDKGDFLGEIRNLIDLNDNGCSENDWDHLNSSHFSVRT